MTARTPDTPAPDPDPDPDPAENATMTADSDRTDTIGAHHPDGITGTSATTPPSFVRHVAALFPVITKAVPLGLLVGLLLVGITGRGAPTAAPAGAARAPAGTVTVDIELGDQFFKPSAITVPAGATVVANITNKGAQEHIVGLRGQNTHTFAPGSSARLEWGPITASTQAWCTVAGHKDAGMVLAINVEGGAPAAAATTAGPATNGATIDASAKPADDWKPRDPTAPVPDGAAVHETTMHVKEQQNEVAPGVRQLQWTYDGAAPGPVLRGKVGDVFRVTLVNDGTMEHSIDFHASKVAPNVEMRTIKPGESLVYEFTARFAGIFTYHCGASPMIHHMGNGMFGAVIIDPPGLAPVDHEYVFVQSELNLGADGEIGDLRKMLAGQNDAVVFNGYYNQYAQRPIKVDPGNRIRAWVVNAAVNEGLAFHVVGTIFDTVWKEGRYAVRPGGAEQGGSQTLDLLTTQGGFVEFTLEAPGRYTFVNHQMKNLSRGAAGVFLVGDGGPGAHD